MSRSLSIDFETRSTVDLKETGVYPYARHEHTDVWCMAWAFDGEEPQIWVPGENLPDEIVEHIIKGGEIRAWNAQFERVIWREIMSARYGMPLLWDYQFVCSMAEASAMSLPRSLDEAARVINAAHRKDDQGYNLMLRMSRPRKFAEDGTPIWWDVEERKQRLYAYCQQDVRVEMAIAKSLRRLAPRERELYLLDQRINDRGVAIDVPLVESAKVIAAEGAERAQQALAEITGGAVTAVTQVGNIKSWMAEAGVPVLSLNKAAVAELLDEELPPEVRRVIEIRSEAGKSSVAKLDRMLAVAGLDGRARGLFFYHGADTGRWAGRLIQSQNFPRGKVPKVEEFIDAVLRRDYEWLDLFYNPIDIVSSMLRSMMRGAPGHDLIAGDFASIEAVVLNWLAGEDKVLENFRRYFAGDKSFDPYIIMAAAMKRISVAEAFARKSELRQPGKAAELGCGYQMGWKKFISAAWQVYQVRVDEAEAKQAVEAYRATHPNVKQFWSDANNAAIAAVREPGSTHVFGGLGNLKFSMRGKYLWLVLPSKRMLAYPAPNLSYQMAPWGDEVEGVNFSAVDGYSNQWSRFRLYGGLIVENIVQAVARDLLSEAMFRLEERGYPVVLHAHDEIVCETPVGEGSLGEMEAIMSELPSWASGLPVKMEGWRAERYRK